MIHFSRQQRTIARPKSVRGIGYWSGEEVTVNFRPAAPDSGYVFVREDKNCRIRAHTENCVETTRRTKLTEDGESVEMVEHVLAALAGMQIDNCEIFVSGSEMPAFDGSSLPVVQALSGAGVVTQRSLRNVLKVEETIRVGDDDDLWIEARPTLDTGLRIAYELDYGPGPIGHQRFDVAVNPATFQQELAPARTFLLESEAVWMRENGVGENVTYSDLLVFGEHGPIQNELRFANECVRHKMLDIVGDLALIGLDLNAQIVARKSGHRHNTRLAASLLRHFQTHGILKQVA